MKTKLLAFSLSFIGCLQAQTYSNPTPVVITDAVGIGTTVCGTGATPGTGSSVINVPISGTISNPADVTINLDLTHTWMGDIVAELVTPAGASCALMKRIGAATDLACGSGSDLIAGNILSFNSGFATAVPTVNPVPAGNYAPTAGSSTHPVAVPLCDLSTFLNGTAINGDWSLNLQDSGEGDTGQLNSWSIVFTSLEGEEFIFTNLIAVLGNPFNEELIVKVTRPTQSASFKLYALDGRLVKTLDSSAPDYTQNIYLDTSTLTEGMYLLAAEIDGVNQNAIKVVKK